MAEPKMDAERLLLKAAEFHGKGDIERAKALYANVLELDEGNARAHVLLGNILYQMGIAEEAEKHYRRAIEIDQNYAMAYFNIGVIRQEHGDLDNAAVFYEKTIKMKPDYPQAYSNLGTVLRDKGDLLAAFKNFKKALEIDGRADVSKNEMEKILGRVQEEVRRRELIREAEELLLEGGAAEEEGHLKRAVEFYRRAIELNPGSIIAYYLMGLAYEKMGYLRLAYETYKRTLGIDPASSNDASPKLINLLERLTDAPFAGTEGFAKTTGTFLERLKLKPEEVMSYRDFIRDQARGKTPDHFLRTGALKESHGDLEGAIADYKKAIEANPRYEVPYYMLGLALESRGETDSAAKNYQKAASLDSEASAREASLELSVLLSDRLGVVQIGAPELSEMLGEFKRTTGTRSLGTFIQRRLSRKSVEELMEGYLLDEAGDAGRAVEKFRQAARIDPNNALAHIILGLAEENMDKPEEAMRHYQRLEGLNLRKATREIPNAAVDIVNEYMTRTTAGGHKVGVVLTKYIELVAKNPDKMLELLGYIEDLKLDSITAMIRGQYKGGSLIVERARIIRDAEDFPVGSEENGMSLSEAEKGAGMVALAWKYKTARAIRSAAIDPLGRRMLAGSETGMVYHLGDDGSLINKLSMEAPIVDLDISRDGAFGVVALQNGVVKQIDMKRNAVVWEVNLADGGPRSVAISQFGSYVAVGLEANIAKLSGGKAEWMRATSGLVSRVDISKDGLTVVAVSDDGGLYIIKENARLAPKENSIHIDKPLRSVAVSPDGKYVSVGTGDGYVYMLDEKKNILWKRELGQVVYGLGVSADGYVVAGSSNGKATLYDRLGKVLWEYSAGENIWSADVSDDGRSIALGCGLVFGNVYLLRSTA